MADDKYVKIDTKDLDRFITVLQAEGAAFPEKIQDSLFDLGQLAANVIFQHIDEDLPNDGIAKFMYDRTAIDISVTSNSVTLEIRGMSEGEAGHPATLHNPPPQVSSPDVNLWVTHEYGIPSDGSSQGPDKDSGTGIKAQVKGGATGYGAGSPYVGEIRRIVGGLTAQLQEVMQAFGAIVAYNAGADIIEHAGKGKIKVDRKAKTALKSAGIQEGYLASLGIAGVETTSTGQINLRGAGGRFTSGRGHVPTTIKGSGRNR